MGDFSRDTFDKIKHYVGVRLQQGVPLVDADWNEMDDIRKHELQSFLKYFIGDGVPRSNDGFSVVEAASPENNFTIAAAVGGPGRCLVGGWEAMIESSLDYTAQRLYNNQDLANSWGVPPLPQLMPPASGTREDIVYLDMWEREVDAAEDGDLVNPDIGIETCVRLKREWVVRVDIGDVVRSTPAEGHVHYDIAKITRQPGATGIGQADIEDLRQQFAWETGGQIAYSSLLMDGATQSSASPIENTTTDHLRQVNVSIQSTASGEGSQVNASHWSTASGIRSQVNASENSKASNYKSQVSVSDWSTASGQNSQVNACYKSTASGDRSQVSASDISTASGQNSQVNASSGSTASGDRSQINASSVSISRGKNSQVNASTHSTAGCAITWEEMDFTIDCTTAGANLAQVNTSHMSHAAGEQSQCNASNASVASGVRSQVNASQSSKALGERSQVNAGDWSIANGDISQVNASSASVTSGIRSQVNASHDSTASGDRSQVNASTGSIASGDISQVNASSASKAGGIVSQVNASHLSQAQGDRSQVNGGHDSIALANDSQVNVSYKSITEHPYTQINASRWVKTIKPYTVCGGYDPFATGPSQVYRKWELNSANGTLSLANTTLIGLSDYGEYFENLKQGELGMGLLMVLEGDKVRPAKKDEEFIGVVSGTAAIRLGDTPFHWHGRYLKDEWGRPVYEEIKDPAWEPRTEPDQSWQPKEGESESDRPMVPVETEADRPLITVQKENPTYDPDKTQIPRSERPKEWTLVGLMGQVHVRCDDTVKPGDYIKCKGKGTGTRSETPTPLRAMRITKPFDGKYAVAYCYLK